MKQIKQPAWILVFALLWALPAHARTDGALMSGKELVSLCGSSENADLMACQSYIAGVIDYHRLIRSLGTAPSVDFCIPENLAMAQIRNVVTRYLIAHTEHHDFIAAPAVSLSLFNTFPCRKRR